MEDEENINGITKEILTNLQPQMAIIVYSENERYYLERRDITGGRMAAGIPLTEECLVRMLEVISISNSDTAYHIIPPGMLYADSRFGRQKYVWYRKPETRHLYFGKQIGIPDGEMMVPGLVYMVNNDSLHVYAFTGKEPKDKLFNAPFFNIYDDGRVCLGSAKADYPAQNTFVNIINYWESLFWKSEFVHLIGNNPVKGNLAVITKECIIEKKKFPEKVLLPAKTKLKDLLI